MSSLVSLLIMIMITHGGWRNQYFYPAFSWVLPQHIEKGVKRSSLDAIHLGKVSFVEGFRISHQPFLQDTDSYL